VARAHFALVAVLLLSPVAAWAQSSAPTQRRAVRPRHVPPALVASPVAASSAIFGAANGVGFAISVATGWHYHLDLIGTGVFALAAYASRGVTLAQGCSAGAVALWAGKLASFLFYRALQTKRDTRLEDTLSTTNGAFGFWLISFLWGWLVSLPHTIAAAVPVAERPPFGVVHAAGLVLFALGWSLETAADWQKWWFKADAANRGRFCDVGVWRLCQHPNWAGNLLLWSGIFVLNAPTLLALGPPTKLGPLLLPAWSGALCRLCVAAISPLFLLSLFSVQANGGSGLEGLNKGYEVTLAKFGNDPQWQEYNRRTPTLLPTLTSVLAWLRGAK